MVMNKVFADTITLVIMASQAPIQTLLDMHTEPAPNTLGHITAGTIFLATFPPINGTL